MNVCEDQLASNLDSADEPECGVNCLFAKIIGHPFPDKKRAPCCDKARCEQFFLEFLPVEINFDENDIRRQTTQDAS